ncbi:putative ankyrin repeat protein [Colletotrichum chlorophyti]|uniref:Putative ankyrin repeat protein n=1 Tax=Colletotrichum chlorophyti TaxID=708187 RepID=A0A1Q8S2V3_9PEZI|nr:putative ankyrin repeat protein [Colletotrichum chlorophyti]
MLPDESPVWRFVNYGTVRQVADLLPKSGIAPCDINKDGKSLLHFAVEWKRPDMCSYLLNNGVNQFFEDTSGFSAAMMAWEIVIPWDATKALAEKTDAIQQLFKKDDVFENFRFSPLHHALLSMPDEDFGKQLKLNFSWVNHQDALGRTPLAWAAAKNYLGKARQLLEAGADVKIADRHGKTALHWAAAAKAFDILSALLDRGADLEARDIIGRTPVWEAAHAPNSHDVFALMIRHGVKIDSRDDIYERTPLHLATYQGQAANVISLLGFGADIEISTTTGRTPVSQAITYNQLSTLKILIQNKARMNVVDKWGETVLHLAARFSPPEVMRLLQSASLDGVRLDAVNVEGRTAAELFVHERKISYYGEEDPEDSAAQAFENLCLKVKEAEAEMKAFCGLCC